MRKAFLCKGSCLRQQTEGLFPPRIHTDGVTLEER